MGRFLNINHPVIQQHLIHDVLACQERSWSVEKIARHLYYSDRMRGCRRGHLNSFQERVRSILLKHGDPIWRYRLRRRPPFQLSSDLMLDILAKKQDKHDIDEEDLSSIDEDDPDLDGYIEQEQEEDLEFVRLCFDPANNVKPQIDTDTDSDADADADADAVAVADADAVVADVADAAVADAADAAVADILLRGKDAQPPMLFKDLVGMDAVAVLKAGFFNVPFKMSRILLHGPPGCAITNLAHSIAYETPHVSCYQSSASGASKDELFELFSKASTTTPSIVFIHDIDAVRLLDALMCMDMFHRPGSLLVIGATTRRHAIDPALKSFGQFDCEIALAIPDENNPRVHILSVLAREMEKLSITIPADFQTCPDCFIHSRAAYYPNSEEKGTETGACGFGTFGATINGGDVSAASDLYRDGLGCGACYQVRCTNSNYCSDNGVTVVITDHGASDRTDFILSKRAFGRMAQTTDAAASLLSLGNVDIEYRRASCSYPSKNITFKIDESSNNPYYLAFVIWYQQGKTDITAVQLCETQNFVCKLLDRTHGAVWTTSSPPSGPLQIRMLLIADDGDETWVVPVNNIPENWKAGETYDSGVQVDV